ncbi:MAG: hypothetical protein IPN38_17805 [Flavobacteriales bacterium]|nr:hypothetical protein [Flavobacteriales bacterium]
MPRSDVAYGPAYLFGCTNGPCHTLPCNYGVNLDAFTERGSFTDMGAASL